MENRRTTKGAELRTHCVSSRLNPDELDLLDTRRGKYARGEYLRMAFLHELPPQPPPEINREAWQNLSKVSGNLATIATAMRGGEHIELEEILTELKEFRRQLIGLKT